MGLINTALGRVGVSILFPISGHRHKFSDDKSLRFVGLCIKTPPDIAVQKVLVT